MSEVDDETPSKHRNGTAPLIEPVVKDQQLFEFLELLFYDDPEPAHFPERIEVNTVSGHHKQQLTSVVASYPFAPIGAPLEATKRGAGQGKPSREKLVILSNRILNAIQRDCDAARKAQCYGIHAWHHSRGDDPFARFLKHCDPKGKYREHASQNPDDDEMTTEQRHSLQIMTHHEKLFSLYGGAFEGMLDRFDRLIERSYDRIEKQDAVIQRQSDMLERALSQKAEREERLEWSRLKAKGVEKALEFGIAMAPPLINQLVGKSIIPTADTAETITLKNFFKTTDQGGALTSEQAKAAFGDYDDTPEHNLVKPGILSADQAGVLYGVATGEMLPDALDKLMPGGPLGITADQAMALQQVFPLEQIAPLMLIFEARRNRGK